MNPLQCIVCSKEFATPQKLKYHQRNAVLNDCNLCDWKFCSGTDYNLHQIVDHFVNSRMCKICKKKYKALSELKKHCQNASPQDCSLCERKFCTPVDYKQHWIAKHRGGAVDAAENEEYTNLLQQQIFPWTWEKDENDNKQLVEENKEMIKDRIVVGFI